MIGVNTRNRGGIFPKMKDIVDRVLLEFEEDVEVFDAFLAELQALSVGDLIVHTEHGIGKYLGLEPVTVGKSKHAPMAW